MYSVPIPAPLKGEILAFDASFGSDISGLRFNTFVGSRVLMATDPTATDVRGDREELDPAPRSGDRVQRVQLHVGRERLRQPVHDREVRRDADLPRRGPGTMPIAPPEGDTCTQKRPDYEHHCVLVFTAAGFRVGDPGRLPCPLEACYINLVASADNPRARRGDLVTVGGLRPDGSIPQDRGRINVIRYRGATAGDFAVSSIVQPRKRRLPPDLRRRVAFSKRLVGLRDGEQLAVDAALRTDVSHLRYAVRTSARLILADSPRATPRPSGFGNACTTVKAGRHADLARRHRRDHGRPATLYLNVVASAKPLLPRRSTPSVRWRSECSRAGSRSPATRRSEETIAPDRSPGRHGRRRGRHRPDASRLQHRVLGPDPGPAGDRRASRPAARRRRGHRRARWCRARRAGAAAIRALAFERRARGLPRGALRRLRAERGRGLGTAMLERAIESALERGAIRMELDTSTDDHAARGPSTKSSDSPTSSASPTAR